jgi:Short C-terminal domain
VVIFGWGPDKQDDLGEVAPCVCPNCHNQVFLHHVRSKKSVRLYFVPVARYGTDDYLVCPICSRGLQLSAPQLPALQAMSSATASFRAGRLPEAPYMAQVEHFWRQLGVNASGQQVVNPASPGAPASGSPGTQARPAAPGNPAASVKPTAATRPAAPAQRPPVTADDKTSWIAQLQKLAELHDQGVLSDADYEAAKQRLLKQE